MKKGIATTIIALICVSLSLNTAWAGSAKHDVAKGIILGAGAALLGAAVINEMNGNWNTGAYDRRHYAPPPRYPAPPAYYRHVPRPPDCRIEQVWIQPEYVDQWVPGHYNGRGRWIQGHYERLMVKKGYWTSQRICRR